MIRKCVRQCLQMLKATWLICFRQLLRALFLQTLSWRHKLGATSGKIQLHSGTVFVLLKDSQNTRNLWVIYLKNHFLEFHKVVRLHIAGEVDKFTTFWCRFLKTLYTKNYLGLNRFTFDRVILKNKKVAVFLRHSVWLYNIYSWWIRITQPLPHINCLHLSLLIVSASCTSHQWSFR